jgi:hypothetical protein
VALEYNLQLEREAGTRDACESLITAGMVRLRPDRFLQKSGFGGPFYGFFGEITLENSDNLSEDCSLPANAGVVRPVTRSGSSWTSQSAMWVICAPT